MSTRINNVVQNLSVMKKELEKPNKPNTPNADKQTIKVDTSHLNDSEATRDTVVFQISSQPIAESKPDSYEIRDAEEAQQWLTDLIGEINSESGSSSARQVHDLNSGSIIELLA